MPRISDSRSNPLDFCRRHMPDPVTAERKYGNVGDGPDGRGNCYGYEDDHPPYEGTDYTCEICKAELTEADN